MVTNTLEVVCNKGGGGYRLSIRREMAITPAATRGDNAMTVFQTCPRVSRTFNLPAMKSVKNPSPANETIIKTRSVGQFT